MVREKINAWDSLLNEAHVWHGSPESPWLDRLADRCRAWLAAEERAQLEGFGSERLGQDYLAARAICRAGLSHYADVHPSAWRFHQNENGKPFIVEPGGFESLQFNLTHTEGLIACIITRAGAVGIDAEETGRAVDIMQIARHFFSETEQAHLAGLSNDQWRDRFFRLWVLKEAYLKGRGVGLSQVPDQFTVELNDGENQFFIDDWDLAIHRPNSEHVAATAVCRQGKEDSIPILWFGAEELFKTGVAVEG